MAFKMKGAPYLKSAFKDSGHGGDAFHDHQVVPTEGAPTAKPGGLMSQNAINLAYAANEKAANSPSNDKSKSKKSKGKKKKRAKRPKKMDSYKCTGGGCGAFD
jgi:hypothetical protein